METMARNYGSALYRLYAKLEEKTVAPESTNPLTKISATEAARRIREGELSSYELVKCYLDRIKHVNLYVNAVVETFDVEALEEAKKVDEYIKNIDKSSLEYKTLAEKKPLLGIPISIKCAFEVKGHRNVSGAYFRRDIPLCTEDAVTVQRIRAAGGIPHCYSNVPDSCLWIESSNKTYGTTSSPYDTRTTCGGSSGGEGSVISSEGSLLGIGSDLAGSVRIPCILNGVFGLKPVNDIPMEGHWPDCAGDELRQMAVIGPLARYAEDIATFYSVLSATPIPTDFIDLKPSKVLYTFPPFKSVLPLSASTQGAVFKVAEFLTHAYNVPTAEFELEEEQKIFEWYGNEVCKPGAPTMAGAVVPTADDSSFGFERLKAFLGVSKASAGVTLVTNIFGEFRPPKVYQRLHEELLEYRQSLNELLKDNVVLVAPAFPKTHYFHNELLLTLYDFYYTALWNTLALPAAVVPIGLDNEGYPITVQLITAKGNNYLLMRLQQVLEKKFGGWKPPRKV